MPRRVFFSFHYDRDISRASIVRNSWITRDRETAGFVDAASWESVKRQGDEAVKRWIDDQLAGTSVTVVLIGNETSTRPLVIHEIQRSYALGKGILGLRIHGLRDLRGRMDSPGINPLDTLGWNTSSGRRNLSQQYPTYDYVVNSGYQNLSRWIEEAARLAGR